MSEQLPRGWRRVSVSEVTSSCLGKMLDRQKHKSGKTLPYLRNQNVRWFSIDDSDLLEMYFEDGELDRYGLRQGDILICEGGEPGRAAIWDGRTSDMKFQKALHRVRPHASLLPEWLVYRLWHDAQAGRLSSYFTGTTIKHFTGTSLARYELPLPPLNEQRRIVAKLDSLQARTRRAREALDAVPPLLEKLRQSILAAAFRGDLTKDWRAKNKDVEPASKLLERIRAERRKKWEESELAKMKAKGKPPTDDKWRSKYKEPAPVDTTGLAELPADWCWASVSDLASIQLGQRRAPEYANEAEFPYVRAANITWRGLDLSDVKKMGFADPASVSLEPGDVVLSEASGSPTEVGKPALWRGEIPGCCFQATVLRLRAWSDLVSGRWLYGAFLRNALLGDFAAMAPGIGILHLTSERMRSWPVPLAPVEEQRVVLDLVDAAMKRAYAAEDTVAALRRAGANLDRSVLAKAFRGELVSQHASDVTVETEQVRRSSAPEQRANVVGEIPLTRTARHRSRANQSARLRVED